MIASLAVAAIAAPQQYQSITTDFIKDALTLSARHCPVDF